MSLSWCYIQVYAACIVILHVIYKNSSPTPSFMEMAISHYLTLNVSFLVKQYLLRTGVTWFIIWFLSTAKSIHNRKSWHIGSVGKYM